MFMYITCVHGIKGSSLSLLMMLDFVYIPSKWCMHSRGIQTGLEKFSIKALIALASGGGDGWRRYLVSSAMFLLA